MIKSGSGAKKRREQGRHNPLSADLDADARRGVRLKTPVNGAADASDSDDEREKYVPKDLSKKLLGVVRRQQDEEQEKQERAAVKEAAKEVKKSKRVENRFAAIMENGDAADEEELEESDVEEAEEVEEVDDVDVEELMMDPEEAKLFALFSGRKAAPGGSGGDVIKSLNDVILEKIMAHERRSVQGQVEAKELTKEEAMEKVRSSLNPKVVEAYTLIARLLKHYSSGKLPKAFNIIPALSNWEEILYLTRPEEWSPGAVRAATRVFASNLNHHLAQRYFSLVLYPRVRYDIEMHKKLNWHLYMALKKALWKPDAFYKGILLPLCESGDCTLKEATIIASLIKKVSIPAAHSAVALYKISQMPYSGANALFIGVLLNKKYALPYEVVDSVVEHFLRIKEEKETPPVLWHQALLVFAQRYKNELTAEQKELLKNLIRHHSHHMITPEIRREILASRNREDDPSVPAPSHDESSKKRKPKKEVKPSFALPGQVPQDSDDEDNAMDE